MKSVQLQDLPANPLHGFILRSLKLFLFTVFFHPLKPAPMLHFVLSMDPAGQLINQAAPAISCTNFAAPRFRPEK